MKGILYFFLISLIVSCNSIEENKGSNTEKNLSNKLSLNPSIDSSEITKDSFVHHAEKTVKTISPFVFENRSWINEESYQCLQEKHDWSACENTIVLIAESANVLREYQGGTDQKIELQVDNTKELGQKISDISRFEKFNTIKEKGIDFDAVYLKKMPVKNRLMLTYCKADKLTHRELLMPCVNTISNLPLQGRYTLNGHPVIFEDKQVKGMLDYQSYYLVKAMSADEKRMYTLLILYPSKEIKASAEDRKGYGFYILKDLDEGFALYQPDFRFDGSGWDLSEGYLFSGLVLSEGKLAFSFK